MYQSKDKNEHFFCFLRAVQRTLHLARFLEQRHRLETACTINAHF